MPRDLLSRRHPHPFLALHIFDKLLHRADSARPTRDPRMQANRHHLRRALFSLFVQLVESRDEVLVEVIGRGPVVRHEELEVVAIEAVGDDEGRISPVLRVGLVVRKVVVVSVAQPGERQSALVVYLSDQIVGIRRKPSHIPARWRAAGLGREEVDAFLDISPLIFAGVRGVIDPSPTMTGQLPPRVPKPGRHERIQLQRPADGVDSAFEAGRLEDLEKSPDPGAAAVLVLRLDVGIPGTVPPSLGWYLGEVGLGVGVAWVGERVFAALFVVDDEGDGDFGVVWPLRMGRGGAVAYEISGRAREGGDAHCGLAGGYRARLLRSRPWSDVIKQHCQVIPEGQCSRWREGKCSEARA